MILIGLHGKARAGKDTAGSILVSGYGFDRYAFADPLRAGLDAMFDLGAAMHGDDKERVIPWIGKSPRQLLQTLGTEWGRNHVAPDIWLRCAERVLEQTRQAGRNLVITDVRFPNEAQWIHDHGGHVWHIRREVSAVQDHTSEHGIPVEAVDWFIDNSGTLEDLRDEIDLVASEI